ncbi:DUF309 domain-containing protein [Planctomyces sp. SH-PL62]|uniref:DUF309 domain-containing protein n=1 Tax=Planctomyces sp. SH-PL62 TaxID=1636152 RepID=UPI00078CB14D|nr:DUF309 domain-containing protein [Planctomyces sp. SH-PL62]AMV38543.1 hypothetical protein VT85_13990 [Planctomyces sp. SH-PL62]
MRETIRSYQDEEPPARTYVPGAGRPKPPRDEARPSPPPIAGDAWAESPAYLRGVDLFNAGCYWEAHEAWEPLWLAHGRRGPIAAVLQGLIKLAAAGVKVRQGRPGGVRSHARRAADHFAEVRAEVGPSLLGLDLDALIAFARSVADDPPAEPVVAEGSAVRVFTRPLRPGGAGPAVDASRRPAAGP